MTDPPSPFRVPPSTGLPFCSLMLMVVYGPDPHTHVQLGSFLFSSPPGRWIAAVYNRPPPPSPHMRSYVEDSHLLSPFHPRLLSWFFSTYGSCCKLRSSVKYQCKTQRSPPISPSSCPIPGHQMLPCTDSFPYANNKRGTEIERCKEICVTLSKTCDVDNIEGHSDYK